MRRPPGQVCQQGILAAASCLGLVPALTWQLSAATCFRCLSAGEKAPDTAAAFHAGLLRGWIGIVLDGVRRLKQFTL